VNNEKKIVQANANIIKTHIDRNKQNEGSVSLNVKGKNDNFEEDNYDTDRDPPMNDEPIRNLIKCNEIFYYVNSF